MGVLLTHADFLKRAIVAHGNRYSYIFSKYINSKEKVCIVCKNHGKFWQSPDEHWKGSGCKKCGFESSHNIARMTKNEFILKSKKIHGNKYTYDLVIYRTNHDKVVITCKIHGKFIQKPNSHLSGIGCPKCGREKIAHSHILSTMEFIKKAKKVFPNYRYKKVNYIRSKLPVIITCKKHGDFKKLPNAILNKSGCQKCSEENRKDPRTMSTREYIKKAIKIHGNRYIYSKVIYKGYHHKIKIICKKHGMFKQIPNNHLRRAGCKKCGDIRRGEKRRSSLDKTLKMFKKIHGNRYIYSKVVYTTSFKKVEIICKKHGPFWQSPNQHTKSGCPICRESKAEGLIRKWLIKNKIKFEPQKRFEWCVNKIKLPFDFYLPFFKTCIEYDGELHYHPYNKSCNGETKLAMTKNNDRIKNRCCKKEGIRLIRIPYWKVSKIELILKNKLKESL